MRNPFKKKESAIIRIKQAREIEVAKAYEAEMELRKAELQVGKLISESLQKDALGALFGQGLHSITGYSDDDYDLILTGGRSRLFGPDSDSYAKKYETLAWIYIAVHVIAETIAGVPLILVEPGTDNIVDNHWFQPVLDKPSPDMTTSDLIERTLVYLETCGKNLWKLKRGTVPGMPPDSILGIEVVTPYNIKPKVTKIDGDEQLAGFEILRGKNKLDPTKDDWEQLDIQDALYIRYFHPTSKWDGLSPMSSVRLEIETDIAANLWNRSFFYNSAMPRGVLETDKRVSPKEADRVRAQWEEKHRGVWKANRVAILPLGLQWKDIQVHHTDMEFLDQQRNVRAKIFSIYRVPLPVAGFYESESASGRSAGIQQYMESFWTLSILPKMRKFLQSMNQSIGKEIGADFAFDLSKVEALAPNLQAQAELGKTLMGTPLSLNEIREMMGVPKGGEELDVVLVPSGLLPIGNVASEKPVGDKEWNLPLIASDEKSMTEAIKMLRQNSSLLLGKMEESSNSHSRHFGGNGKHGTMKSLNPAVPRSGILTSNFMPDQSISSSAN